MLSMSKSTLFFSFLLISSSLFAQDPARFQGEIDVIKEKQFQIDNSKEIVVFTGSSSIRMWRDVQDFYPHINAINTGFGGSHMSDLLHYLDVLVLKHNPDKVFIYEGDNDIADSKKNSNILDTTTQVVNKIKEAHPEVEIYLISPKPSISRWSFKEQYEGLNELFDEYASSSERVTFVDVWNPMLNEKGVPIPGIFIEDNLHMNEKGYEIWGDVIKTYLK